MKYKLINTGNPDQHIMISHGVKKDGVVGHAGRLPKKIMIPGKSRSEEGRNYTAVEEDVLRKIFGIYETAGPGKINPDKPAKIAPENVKFNTRLLDSGRIIVTDEFGNHVFGVGGAAYQKSALDSVKNENEMLKDKLETLVNVLVNDGFTEEQARAIVENKAGKAQSILKEKEIGIRSTGVDLKDDPESELKPTPLEAAKVAFKDAETVNVFCGDEPVKEYKTSGMHNAIGKITKLAAEAGIEVSYDDAGLPWFQDSEKRLVRLV